MGCDGGAVLFEINVNSRRPLIPVVRHHNYLSIRFLLLVTCLAGCNQRSNSFDGVATEGKPKQESMADSDFPPKPAWKPNVAVDLDRTVNTFAYYTDGKARFVVFTNGTCIAVPAGATDAESHAKDVLDKIFNSHPDFNPLEMDDGNYMVTYSQKGAASIIFADEYQKHHDYIDRNHQDGVVRDEVLLNANKQANVFDDRGKIGLFGRARMFLDAQNPKVVHVHSPDTK